jgi:acylphosphatase
MDEVHAPEQEDPVVLADGDRMARCTAYVSGYVQGVGFRAFVRSRAIRLGLVGSATNLADGRVEVIAEGSLSACRSLVALLRDGWTPGDATQVTLEWGRPTGGLAGFSRR